MQFGVFVPHSTTVPPNGKANEIDLSRSKGTNLLYQGNRARIDNFITPSDINLVNNAGHKNYTDSIKLYRPAAKYKASH